MYSSQPHSCVCRCPQCPAGKECQIVHLGPYVISRVMCLCRQIGHSFEDVHGWFEETILQGFRCLLILPPSLCAGCELSLQLSDALLILLWVVVDLIGISLVWTIIQWLVWIDFIHLMGIHRSRYSWREPLAWLGALNVKYSRICQTCLQGPGVLGLFPSFSYPPSECGANFTSKLEGMFKDMELSREMMVSFKEVSH